MLEGFGVPGETILQHSITPETKAKTQLLSRLGEKQVQLRFEQLHITILHESPGEKVQENPKNPITTS